jgi:hypothetical protein
VTKRRALKLRVRLSRARLDQALAAGVDPASAPRLEVRARQLVAPRLRRRVASGVERVLEECDGDPRRGLTAAVPVLCDEVAMARGYLMMLADALRTEPTVNPRGVAMVDGLLRDPYSPLYVRGAPGALALRARAALDCLLAAPGRAATPEDAVRRRSANRR